MQIQASTCFIPILVLVFHRFLGSKSIVLQYKEFRVGKQHLIENVSEVDAIDCSIVPRNSEGRLRKAIFCAYDKSSRPDEKISIVMEFHTASILYDESQNQLHFSSYFIAVRKWEMSKEVNI